ncbi:hypothetical protein [Leptospira alstonii]|nr:hypothetical protein [Leptospira alstonii]
MKIIKWAMIFLCSISISCKNLAGVAQRIAEFEKQKQYDPKFNGDILNGPNDFNFDPMNLPKIDKTREDELAIIYPSEPSLKLTFLKPIDKVILGKRFKMDRLYAYYKITKESISDGIQFGYVAQERLTLIMFISQGVVAQYLIIHELLGSDGKWRNGKYARKIPNFKGNRFESWPNESVDNDCYFVQRVDRALILGDEASRELNCPLWEAVPVNKNLQRQTPLVKILMYILSPIVVIMDLLTMQNLHQR